MREIGGYFELETLPCEEYYPGLLKFNLGRTAITWYLKERGISHLYLPDFLCGSVVSAVAATQIRVTVYPVRADFLPDETALPDRPLRDDECLFLLNAYGLLKDEQILLIRDRYRHVLLDFTHAFFQRPLPGIAAVASVRKFFGLTDGAYLQSDVPIALPEKRDSSASRFSHVLGRYEHPAGEHYAQMLATAHSYEGAGAMRMSPLTENLLRGIDYPRAAARRMDNYLLLDALLRDRNALAAEGHLRTPDAGPFVYPLLAEDGPRIRRALAEESIFVPTYWSNVIENAPETSAAHRFARDILALPCDQRYGREDMRRVAEAVLRLV